MSLSPNSSSSTRSRRQWECRAPPYVSDQRFGPLAVWKGKIEENDVDGARIEVLHAGGQTIYLGDDECAGSGIVEHSRKRRTLPGWSSINST